MITGKVQNPDQLEKPRRMSNLALNCAIYFLDMLMPTDIERGAIAIPESIKERAAERGLGRRRRSYDPLRSPPPEFVSYADEAVGERRATSAGLGSRAGMASKDGEGADGPVEKESRVREEEVR
jgi:hypothetical protein